MSGPTLNPENLASVPGLNPGPTLRVVHHKIDQVGNNLTRVLAWCGRHQEPVWIYGDGSFRCWWEDITGHKQHLPEFGPDDHEIVAGPWVSTPMWDGDDHG